jgi:microcystin-dependent protein
MAKFLSKPIIGKNGGDEGGEILLEKSDTNTTISGTGVTVDVYQNKLRFFEQGGTARGAYIDITAASAGVGSNLLSGGSGATTLDGLSDVTAPSPSSGDFLKWNGTAWVNDPIDLATDTTGGYVSSLVAGTGITLANNSGEAATPTISISTSALIPSGSMQMYAGSAAPNSDWLICDGSAVSRSTYAALYAVIGTTFGTGNGSTTFNIPDMRSRMPIGVGTGTGLSARTLAATGGVESVTLTGAQSGTSAHGHGHTFRPSSNNIYGDDSTAQAGAHTHTVDGRTSPSATHGHTGTISVATAASNQNASQTPSTSSAGTHSHTVYITGSVSNSTEANATSSHENMTPFLAVNFIIKV